MQRQTIYNNKCNKLHKLFLLIFKLQLIVAKFRKWFVLLDFVLLSFLLVLFCDKVFDTGSASLTCNASISITHSTAILLPTHSHDGDTVNYTNYVAVYGSIVVHLYSLRVSVTTTLRFNFVKGLHADVLRTQETLVWQTISQVYWFFFASLSNSEWSNCFKCFSFESRIYFSMSH